MSVRRLRRVRVSRSTIPHVPHRHWQPVALNGCGSDVVCGSTSWKILRYRHPETTGNKSRECMGASCPRNLDDNLPPLVGTLVACLPSCARGSRTHRPHVTPKRQMAHNHEQGPLWLGGSWVGFLFEGAKPIIHLFESPPPSESESGGLELRLAGFGCGVGVVRRRPSSVSGARSAADRSSWSMLGLPTDPEL